MSALPKQAQMARKWTEKAARDLLMAEHALTLPKDQCPFDLICFHAQQAVEKYLKAVLILRQVNVPRTHDLTELAGLLPKDFKLPVSPHEIASLTPYAIQTRYPAVGDEPDSEEAIQAVRIARRLKEAIQKHFPPPP